MSFSEKHVSKKYAVLLSLTLVVLTIIPGMVKWWMESLYLEEIREGMIDPQKETTARRQLRKWVEKHPYDSRSIELALWETPTDLEYFLDVVRRYVAKKANDFDVRSILILSRTDLKEKLNHTNYILEHSSPQEYDDYSALVILKKRIHSRIEENIQKEMDGKQIDSTNETSGLFDDLEELSVHKYLPPFSTPAAWSEIVPSVLGFWPEMLGGQDKIEKQE